MSTKTYTLIENTRDEHSFPDKDSLLNYLGFEEVPPSQEVHVHADTPDNQKTAAILIMLSDRRFTLRTVSSIIEKTGVADFDEITTLLDEADIAYITRIKRGTGEMLIGLASRN